MADNTEHDDDLVDYDDDEPEENVTAEKPAASDSKEVKKWVFSKHRKLAMETGDSHIPMFWAGLAG